MTLYHSPQQIKANTCNKSLDTFGILTADKFPLLLHVEQTAVLSL